MSPHLVAIAALRAARQDFWAHPADPILVLGQGQMASALMGSLQI